MVDLRTLQLGWVSSVGCVVVCFASLLLLPLVWQQLRRGFPRNRRQLCRCSLLSLFVQLGAVNAFFLCKRMYLVHFLQQEFRGRKPTLFPSFEIRIAELVNPSWGAIYLLLRVAFLCLPEAGFLGYNPGIEIAYFSGRI